MRSPKLVMIEWEDSAQPVAAWTHLHDLDVSIVRITSVGWLVRDTKKLKALAPNISRDGTPQVSGVITIPTRCVIRIKTLAA